MHILVISDAVVGTDQASGEKWSLLTATVYKGNLYASAVHGLTDYDVFIIDASTLTQGSSEGLDLIQEQIVDRVAGGGCLICFADVLSLPWLPVQFSARGALSGKRFTLEAVADEPVRVFFEKRQEEISYKTKFSQGQGWTPIACALDRYPIAGYGRHGAGLVIMLPEFKNRAVAIRDILDNVVPKLLPQLHTTAPSVTDEEPPAWLNDFPIPAAHALEGEIAQLDERINSLRDRREKTSGRHRDLAGYQGLLWLEGRPLEAAVQKALNLLGIPAEPKNPVDLACPLKKGGELYIEIEGTTGQVQVRKGRQLLGYIAEADDPSAVIGAIIGNPHRDQHPSQRPSEGTNGGPFSPQLLSLAQKQGWSLVTCVQLFEWVKRCLDGDKSAQREAREALRFD